MGNRWPSTIHAQLLRSIYEIILTHRFCKDWGFSHRLASYKVVGASRFRQLVRGRGFQRKVLTLGKTGSGAQTDFIRWGKWWWQGFIWHPILKISAPARIWSLSYILDLSVWLIFLYKHITISSVSACSIRSVHIIISPSKWRL